MLRTLPILLAGAAVALVTSEAMRRFGWLPGTVAGLVLASNPMFLALAREVRGYSLLVLCAVASTLVVMRDRQAGRLGRVAYIVAAGVGVGTHLFMGWVMVGHVLFLWVRRRLNSEWVFRLVAATLIGAVPYILTLDVILHQGRMRTMVAVFPFRVVRNVLGGEPVTVAVLGGVCLFAIWSVRRDRLTTILGAAAVAAVLITWLAPNEPAARFFVWSVPAVAMAAAVAVHHRPVVALPVLVVVVAAALSVRPDYTEDPLANRRLAPIIEAAIDGKLDKALPYPGWSCPSTTAGIGPLIIGNNRANGDYFGGRVQYVRVSNVARTAFPNLEQPPLPPPTEWDPTGNVARQAYIDPPAAGAIVDTSLAIYWLGGPGGHAPTNTVAMSWPEPVTVHRMIMWDLEPSPNGGNIYRVNLEFSDGTVANGAELGLCRAVNFPAKEITGRKISPFDTTG